MSYLKRSCSGGKSSKFFFPALSSLAVVTVFLCLPCRGDEATVPGFPQPVDWVVGPARASLGAVADIQVPAGFKFTDAQGAASVLPHVQQNVLGVLTPESGGWWVVFEYSQIGYVKDADKQALEPDAILKTVRAQVDQQTDNSLRRGKTPITGLSWALEPAYHSDGHSLEWAIAADSGPGSVTNVNHTIRLLGRRGALDATAVLPGTAQLASIPLQELVKAITFKSGESYADFRPDDAVCPLNLAQLIASENSLQSDGSASKHSLAGNWLFWVGLLILGSGAAASILLLKARRRRKSHSGVAAAPSLAQPTTAVANPSPSANGTNHAVAAPNGRPAAKPVKSQNHNHRGSRRRKSVDYTRYFMDLRSAVSDHSVYMDQDSTNGYQDEYQTPEPEPMPPASVAPRAENTAHAHASAHAEMIAHQKNLIEEQQRLIHEQTKLIEEKTKLVAEKNQLLARQAELLDERLLPS